MNATGIIKFGETIRQQRRKRGWSQAFLGNMLNMGQAQLARIEAGKQNLRALTLLEISRALDLEPMLVPKQLVPAVRYLIEDPANRATTAPKLVGNEPEDAETDELADAEPEEI
jgi:HTH-type transcriptional regulator / antitoxin HipB